MSNRQDVVRVIVEAVRAGADPKVLPAEVRTEVGAMSDTEREELRAALGRVKGAILYPSRHTREVKVCNRLHALISEATALLSLGTDHICATMEDADERGAPIEAALSILRGLIPAVPMYNVLGETWDAKREAYETLRAQGLTDAEAELAVGWKPGGARQASGRAQKARDDAKHECGECGIDAEEADLVWHRGEWWCGEHFSEDFNTCPRCKTTMDTTRVLSVKWGIEVCWTCYFADVMK